MTTLLQVNASIYNSHGQSSQLADQFVAAFRRAQSCREDRGARRRRG